MLGIEINGEKLDLPPDTVMELERQNPFLQFEEALIGDYSLPFSVKANNKNLRLLQYAAIASKRVTNEGIEALLYDKSIQTGSGKIKIEKSSINLNKIAAGSIDCYFLTGSSGFWQDIKDKNLRDIDVGGDRSFAWSGLSTITDGFWKHIHEVVAAGVGAYDYAFYPVINKGWIEGDVYPPVMNMMYYDPLETFPVRFPTTYVPLDVRERNRIVPFPYLHYVLKKAVAFGGWTITGDIFDDADFLKVTMINFRAIDWCYVKVNSGVVSATYRDPVVFNLQDNLPDISISAFLIALRNRFGWRFKFNNTTKTITVSKLSELSTSAPVDMTSKSSPLMNKPIQQEKPIYALRNRFATSIGDGAPDFNVILFQGDVNSTADLPAAAEALYGHAYLVIEENNYYLCQQNQDTEAWEWVLYTANIYDFEPVNSNNEIVTDATLVGNEFYSEYLDFLPRIDNQGEWIGRTDDPASWGIHLCFYFGLRNNKSGDPFPFASHHIYDSQGYTLAAWSLAFKAKKTDGSEVGLYDLNWKSFMDMLNSPEEIEHTLYLPLHEYLKLDFSDRIVVAGVELFIKQIKLSIPYKGVISCTSIRV